MPLWLLILRYKLTTLLRRMRDHAFTLFVLGPMIVLGFYYILEPSLMRGAAWLREAAGAWNSPNLYPVSLLLALAVAAFSLPSTLRAVYVLSSADGYLDALPVGAWSRFHVLAVGQLARKLPIAAALAVLLSLLTDSRLEPAVMLQHALTVLPALAGLALVEIPAVLLLVRYRQFRAGRLLGHGLIAGALALGSAHRPVILLAFLPLLPSAAVFHQAIGSALSIPGSWLGRLSEGWLQVLCLAALYSLAGLAYVRWRDEDCERARESARRSRGSGSRFADKLRQWAGSALAEHVLRDWRLTRRAFSAAVYMALASAILLQAAALVGVSRWGWDPAWAPKTAQLAGALSVLCLAALAPLLLQHQLSYFWLERSTGADPELIRRAKVWYACLLALPVVSTTSLAGVLSGSMGFAEAVLFVAKVTLISLSVASLVGAAAFEIAGSPVLGLLLSGLFAMGIAGIFIFTDLWPVWGFIHIYLIHHLYERPLTALEAAEEGL